MRIPVLKYFAILTIPTAICVAAMAFKGQGPEAVPDAHVDLSPIDRTLEVPEGSVIDSLARAYKGKVLYIDVWATWCGPCREQFPFSAKLEEAFGSDVVFVYLCIASTKPNYQKFNSNVKRKGIDLYLDEVRSRQLTSEYSISAIPYYFMIDKQGAVAASGYDIRPSEQRTTKQLKALVAR